MKHAGLGLSILLNVALAGGLILVLSKHPPSSPESIQSAAPTPIPSPPLPAANPSPRAGRVPFHWSQVESADYQVYIKNLRAIGCPEPTLRDIIVADVNSLFAPRYAALSQSEPELAWWGKFDPRKRLRPDFSVQLQALHEEKKALLTRLLGTGVVVDTLFAQTSVQEVREANVFSFLPETKQAAVRDLVKRYQALRERSELQWKGLPSDERDALEKELHEARSRDLTMLLTPEEMREFEVRDSPAADIVRDVYGRANLTESEFRTMYELRRDLEQRIPDPGSEDWLQLEADYAAALGPERFKELRMQNDSMWRVMQEVSTDKGFTSEEMAQAYALKQEYTAKMAQAIGPMFDDPQQNLQPLRDLASEMDNRLTDLIGPEAVKHLDRLGVLPRLVVQDDGIRKSYSLSRGAFSN